MDAEPNHAQCVCNDAPLDKIRDAVKTIGPPTKLAK
jgi:hypothetical protein